ncbi:MAG: succinylglutamate desuccinylase/aspartoacylase family protein [Fimbriimonadaceae bacterium]|nr:succinylglutamate desuccinylase/aspartoacylase family protein [Fimbriimonadaceae bacterium]
MHLAALEPRSLPLGRHLLRCATSAASSADVAVLRGGDGPVALLLAAVHGDEYEGPTALAALAAELEPGELQGTLVAVPVLNEPAFYATRRCGPDGENLARVFPGDLRGSVTAQIAAATTGLLRRVDLLVDLHAAGTFYTLHPWAGYATGVTSAVLEQQRRLAAAVGLDFVWGTPLPPGRSLSTAAALGIPAIYVEQTGSGLARPDDVARLQAGLHRVLRAAGLLPGPLSSHRPRWWRESEAAGEGHLQVDHPAPRPGVWRPAVGIWEWVVAGQPLGVVSGPLGQEARVVRAARSGRVAMLRTAPPVQSGDYLAVVVPVEEQP